MTNTLSLSLALTASGMLNSPAASASGGSGDAQFSKLAEEYISGYLKWRPLAGTSLGFHQYDGKATDFSHTSLEIELARLKSFDRRLEELDRGSLSAQAFYDYRILHNAIKREIFSFEGIRVYWQNPMTYSSALDVNTYIKRNFAPLEERARSIIAILKQAPRVFAAARSNLAEALPRPQIETYLKEQKLPKANEHYALGREKYEQLLNYGEMITRSPEQLLEMGMAELSRKQKVFADAARQIDSTKKPVDVFQAIQKDHPTEQGLIPDTARNLDMIRQFVINHHIITLPSPVRAAVKET